MPLATSPSTVTAPDVQRRICTCPFARITISYRSPELVSRNVNPVASVANPTTLASMRQSAQVILFTLARSRPVKSEFARESVRQRPATTVQSGPNPLELVRLKESANSTVPARGGPEPPPPPVPPSIPPSGVPPSGRGGGGGGGGGGGSAVGAGGSPNTIDATPPVLAARGFPKMDGAPAVD